MFDLNDGTIKKSVFVRCKIWFKVYNLDECQKINIKLSYTSKIFDGLKKKNILNNMKTFLLSID